VITGNSAETTEKAGIVSDKKSIQTRTLPREKKH
jgi:hypothetical protein